MTPHLREIRQDDWPAIDRIQRESFPPSAVESREALESIALLAPGTCLVAEAEGLMGYVLAHPWKPDDLPPLQTVLPGLPPDAACLFIHDLAISPAARGGGLAKRLAREILARARGAGLSSSALISVQESRDFWERLGFCVRPELTVRFQKTVERLYQTDFVFMTAKLE